MTRKQRRLIRSTIIRVAVVAVFATAALAITTNATITNDIAIAQLNGGDDAYLAMQAYSVYQRVEPVVGTLLTVWAAFPIIKLIYNKIKETSK